MVTSRDPFFGVLDVTFSLSHWEAFGGEFGTYYRVPLGLKGPLFLNLMGKKSATI